MRADPASRILARTTLDIDTPLLKDLKRLQRSEKKSLGRLVSDLQALAARRRARRPAPVFGWVSQDMTSKVDIADRDALSDVLDRETEAASDAKPQRQWRQGTARPARWRASIMASRGARRSVHHSNASAP
jgi:hypothetical protein